MDDETIFQNSDKMSAFLDFPVKVAKYVGSFVLDRTLPAIAWNNGGKEVIKEAASGSVKGAASSLGSLARKYWFVLAGAFLALFLINRD